MRASESDVVITENAGRSEKKPNEALRSWFLRSGWSKGELARQVNRRARRLGAHHISTDTSRVRRWLDGEQPREPIPRILSELFSERFGAVISPEDLGLRAPRPSGDSGADLPWAGQPTLAMIHDFSRSDLMLARRGFLGASLSMTAGAALVEPMQRWLVPTPPSERPLPGEPPVPVPDGRETVRGHLSVVQGGATRSKRLDKRSPRISLPEVSQLEQTTAMFRRWDAHCGGGLRRKAVVGQLHEVTELLRECQSSRVTPRLFRVTAELAELAGWMSYDVGLQPTAQKYFVLALHAAKEAEDQALGAYILSNMSRQMTHLGRPDDALELIHLAQYGSREEATPRTQAMLYAVEARAYANLGEPGKCKRATRMAEDAFEDVEPHHREPDWITFFTEGELYAECAHAYRDLAYVAGRSPSYASLARPIMEKAVSLFARELAEGPGVGHRRSYALNLIGLATVHLLQREPEGCASLAGQACDVAAQIRSERVNNRLRSTGAKAEQDFGHVADVVRLGQRIKSELPDPAALAAAG
ncbi:hypothetical protein [Streptomyces sp. NPDC005438]|uniref:hypothetical protein n=1 Tax=Streptomyces sp. NPDC005438 TaxID=3156880 RepID=UPI0033A9E525